MKIVSNSALRSFVETKLYDDQSPRAIGKRIQKREKHLLRISKNSIYRFIKSVHGRRIEAHRAKQKRRRKGRLGKRKGSLDGRTFIDQRPLSSNKRSRIGHVEADFIVSGKSGKGVLLVVVDRKSRVTFLERIVTVRIIHVHRAFQRIQKRFPEMKTITTDNDLLLQKHKELARILKVKIYFCDPYASWQKGTVENTNKYIRKFIPKGSSLAHYSSRFVRSLEDKLNRRIMECLDYQTPEEILRHSRKRKQQRKSAVVK